MKTLLLLLILLNAWSAPKFRDFDKQVYVNGVGQIRMVYKYTGEPVSRPQALRIFVKCEGAKMWDPVGEFQMCDLDDYELDAKNKKLRVKYVDGRVEDATGKSYCDRAADDLLPLDNLCKKP